MLELVKQNLKKHFRDSRGCTLVEVAVALAILAMGAGLVGSTVFQTLSVQRFWQDNLKAEKDTRHAGSWFAADALKATATNLSEGTPAAEVTITTPSGDVSYSVSVDDELVRQEGANENVVAENVVSVQFLLSDQTLTFTLEVESSRGGTETLTLQNYLRLLES